jgi:hypothetical protein
MVNAIKTAVSGALRQGRQHHHEQQIFFFFFVEL